MRKVTPLRVRFDAKWKLDESTGCWMWTASCDRFGYGQIAQGDGLSPYRAHRVAWELYVGPIPRGLFVLHNCEDKHAGFFDNRRCVNPSHMFLGTHQDNAEDKSRKGRCRTAAVPARTNPVRLSAGSVRMIRERRGGGETISALARELRVSRKAVKSVLTGRTWRHVA